MSTFLQLVNAEREECDAAGAGDLATVSGVTGESLRFKNWTIRAWEEIQDLYDDWRWMRASYSFSTTANVGLYASVAAGIATRFGRWSKDYCSVYLTASGVSDQIKLTWIDYGAFRDCYLIGSQTSSKPINFSISPSNELLVGPKPSSTLYTIAGEYFKSPQTLSADDDIPELPEQHRLIMYRAMKKYARFNASPEIYSDANEKEADILTKLTVKYREIYEFGYPVT